MQTEQPATNDIVKEKVSSIKGVMTPDKNTTHLTNDRVMLLAVLNSAPKNQSLIRTDFARFIGSYTIAKTNLPARSN